MAVLNPEHLLEQAELLIRPPPSGPPRQVDLRRAVSAAYYALFHHVLTASADELIGKTKRNTPRYGLIYRSVDHRALRELCLEIRKPTLTRKYAAFAPLNGFGPNIAAFASACIELQDKRHLADYDPANRMRTSDGRSVIAIARSAIQRFERVSPNRRKLFLTLLLFTPR